MQKKWIVAPTAPPEFFKQFPEINSVILQLLYNREIRSQNEIDEFLSPEYSANLHNPFLFQDMSKAVGRIFQAIKNKEKIVVYGDYDADGVSSSIVMVETLQALGANVRVYLPDRTKEGYGLNATAISSFAKWGAKLIVTVDCGVSNKSEIAFAKTLGIETIVTDHHCEPPELPEALAIVNPQLSREKYPYRQLAGVGVAFKVAQALLSSQAEELGEEKLPFGWEKWLLDLVAIGTVSDMMPLLGENRTLVKYGLIVLNKTRRSGLKALLKEAGIEGKELDSCAIGFQIGPRINAAGRLEHARVAFDLLSAGEEEAAAEIASNLGHINRERQRVIEKIIREVDIETLSKQKCNLIFIHGQDWPVGVVGLAAGRLMDKWYRPTIVMTSNGEQLVASGRSIPEFSFTETLQTLENYFSHYGGHAKACGFTLKDQTLLDEFKIEFARLVDEQIGHLELVPKLFIEKEISLSEINWELYETLSHFEPFGQDNDQPRFLVRDLQVVGLQRVGRNANHLRVMVNNISSEIKTLIGFGLGEEWGERLKVGDMIDAVLEISVNQWNGTRELQRRVVDLKII